MTDLNTQDVLQLGAFLPYRLSVLSNTLSKQIETLYKKQFGVNLWQWRVMAVLGEAPGLNASAIVERTAMDKVAVSRSVSALIALGHIKRKAEQADGRRSRLYLTRKGQALYDRIVPLAVARETEITAALSKTEVKELTRLLDRVAAVVSPERPLW